MDSSIHQCFLLWHLWLTTTSLSYHRLVRLYLYIIYPSIFLFDHECFFNSCSIQFDSVRCFQPCSSSETVCMSKRIAGVCRRQWAERSLANTLQARFCFQAHCRALLCFPAFGQLCFQRLFWRSASSWQRGSRTAYSLLMPQSSSGPPSGALEFRSSGLLPGSARRLTTKVWRDIMACLSKPCLQTLALWLYKLQRRWWSVRSGHCNVPTSGLTDRFGRTAQIRYCFNPCTYRTWQRVGIQSSCWSTLQTPPYQIPSTPSCPRKHEVYTLNQSSTFIRDKHVHNPWRLSTNLFPSTLPSWGKKGWATDPHGRHGGNMATRGGIWQAKCCSPRRPSFPDRPITLSGLIGLPHSSLKFSRQETPNCVKPTQTQKQKLLYFEWSLPWHVGWWLSGEGCHLVEQHFIQNKNFHKIFGWGPARNTDLRRSWLRSGVEHWTHRVAVEVRRGTLSVHPCSWWRGRRGGEGPKEGRKEGGKEGRKEGGKDGRKDGRKEGRKEKGRRSVWHNISQPSPDRWGTRVVIPRTHRYTRGSWGKLVLHYRTEKMTYVKKGCSFQSLGFLLLCRLRCSLKLDNLCLIPFPCLLPLAGRRAEKGLCRCQVLGRYAREHSASGISSWVSVPQHAARCSVCAAFWQLHDGHRQKHCRCLCAVGVCIFRGCCDGSSESLAIA